MASRALVAALLGLCAALSGASVATVAAAGTHQVGKLAQEKKSLRLSAAQQRGNLSLGGSLPVPAGLAAPAAPKPPPAATAEAAGLAHGPPADEASSPVIAQLRSELQETKQRRMNIMQLQQALSADVALLRESSALQRVAATPHSRSAAQVQVRKTEALVKELSGMLRESRVEAVEDAKQALREAQEVAKAAGELAAEAERQVKLLSSSRQSAKAPPPPQPHSPPATSQDTESDDTDDDDEN